MNHDLLSKVADAIEAEPQNFDMTDFFAKKNSLYGEAPKRIPDVTAPRCGSVCCIGGMAVALTSRKGTRMFDWKVVRGLASDALGLTLNESYQLFYSSPFWDKQLGRRVLMEDMTAAEVVPVLRRLAAGKITL